MGLALLVTYLCPTQIAPTVKGVRKGRVLGLKPPLEHNILQNFITYAKEINCFRILFAC